MIISYKYALKLSVTLPMAEGTGWKHYETDSDWWTMKAWIMAQDGGKVHRYRWDDGKTKRNAPH